MKITNNSRALQGVHSVTGLVFIEPGQTRDIDVANEYVARVKSLPFFGIEGVERDLSKAPNLPPPANGTDPLDHDANGQKGGAVRDDGPTIAEFVAAGYPAKNYPPAGYASRSTPEEIAAAIAAEAVIVIPDDWADLHHMKKIALAEQISGKAIEATADQTKTEVAHGIIAAEVEKRKAA